MAIITATREPLVHHGPILGHRLSRAVSPGGENRWAQVLQHRCLQPMVSVIDAKAADGKELRCTLGP